MSVAVALNLLCLSITASVIGWTDDMMADRLSRNRLARRCHYYAACAATLFTIGTIIALFSGPNISTGVWLVWSIALARKAWKHRNDDDRNDRLRRLWAWAKTRLPKPRLIPIRPIGVPT